MPSVDTIVDTHGSSLFDFMVPSKGDIINALASSPKKEVSVANIPTGEPPSPDQEDVLPEITEIAELPPMLDEPVLTKKVKHIPGTTKAHEISKLFAHLSKAFQILGDLTVSPKVV